MVILSAELPSITAFKHLGTGVINHVRRIDTLVTVIKSPGISKSLLPISLVAQIRLALLSYCLHQALSFDRAQMPLEFVRLDEGGCFTHQVLLALVVLARRVQSALWTPVVVQHVTLKVYCRVFKLFKPFIL